MVQALGTLFVCNLAVDLIHRLGGGGEKIGSIQAEFATPYFIFVSYFVQLILFYFGVLNSISGE